MSNIPHAWEFISGSMLTLSSPVNRRMRTRANRSGYSASTLPGTFIAMTDLKKLEMRCSIRLSKVELQARATLAVPEDHKTLISPRSPMSMFSNLNLGQCSLKGSVTQLTNDIRKDEVPASNEGPDFSDGHVAVQVSRARLRHPSTELCIAKSCQHGRQGRHQETKDDRGTSLLSCYLSSQHVDPCTECRAHAQSHQIQSGEASSEASLLAGKVHNSATQQRASKRGQFIHHG